MEHLTYDEIIDFVSAKKMNDESLKLAAKVNGHIRNCGQCLKIVRSFQMIADEFGKMGSGVCSEKNEHGKFFAEENNRPTEPQNEIEDFDGYR